MSNNIISNTKGERQKKTFTAIFNRYDTSTIPNVFIEFKEVRDEKGNLLKEKYSIEAWEAKLMIEGIVDEHLIGHVIPDERVTFTAYMIVDPKYPDGFDFADVTFIKIKNNPLKKKTIT